MRSSPTSWARKISGGLIVLASVACSSGKGGATAPEDEVQPDLPIDASYALAVSSPADSLSVGKYLQLKAAWTSKRSKNPFIDTNAVWTSSNPAIASVARRGLVTGNRVGSVTITTKSGNLRVSKSLVVAGVTYVQPVVNSKRLLGDDFTSYTGTAAFMANVGAGRLYNDGVNQQLATIDTSVKYNGHRTLKYNQAGGTNSTPELWPSLPSRMSNVWLHTVIRYSPGWTTKGVLNSTDNSYKILGFGWSNYYARAGFHLANTSAYQIFTNAVTTTGATAMPAVFGMAGSPTTEWQDGAWYDYYLHYEVLTSTTTRLRLWRGRAGQTPVLVATVNNKVSSGYSAPLVGTVMLGQNFNQTRASSQSQAIWYGMWEVMDGAAYPNPFKIPGA